MVSEAGKVVKKYRKRRKKWTQLFCLVEDKDTEDLLAVCEFIDAIFEF
jgi:hypothetical protein